MTDAPTIEIRPMHDHDVAEAGAVWHDAFASVRPDLPDRTPAEIERDTRRLRHLLRTDPGGSFVAEADGTMIGVTQGHRRGGIFVLATLGVLPDAQDRGAGGRLLRAALEYGKQAPVGYIFSSMDPRALHRYVRAGFDLHPAAVLTGRPGIRGVSTDGVRIGGSAADLDLVDEVDRTVRGQSRRPDIEFFLGLGVPLLLDDEGGYALVNGDRLVALGATSEVCASRLLAAVLTGIPDGKAVEVAWVTAEQRWAFAAATRVLASIRIHGAVMTRGLKAIPSPYLPNGIFG